MPPASPTVTGAPDQAGLPCDLQRSAIKALYALPEAFPTAIHISDFRATDVFALSTALGASIEEAAVQGLHRCARNGTRRAPYDLCRFERQAQTRPDVRLITEAPEEEAVFRGIELQGWFAPSKEGAPTFRYTVRAVCVRAGRFVSRLSLAPERCGSGQSALAGYALTRDPRPKPPYGATAAGRDMRARNNRNGTVIPALPQSPYPSVKIDPGSDRTEDDRGHNFRRAVRYGWLDDFVDAPLPL